MTAPPVLDPAVQPKPKPAQTPAPAPATAATAATPGAAPPPAPPPAPPAPSAPSSQAPPPLAPSSAPSAVAPPTSLLNQTITPGPQTNRVQLAQDAFDTFAKSSDPYYQKALRDATSQAAGAGQLGSGQLRTSLGDLAHQRQLELDTQRATLLNNATAGSIADQYANIGIAQQQQGFQAQQQQQATANQLAAEQLQLAKTGQSAQTALAEGALTGTYGGGQTLAAQEAARQNALAEKQFGLASELGTGQLALAQQGQAAQQALAEKQFGLSSQLGTGQLTLAQQAEQARQSQAAQQLELAKTGQAQQFGLAQQGLGLQAELGRGGLALAQQGQQQQAQQFAQSLAFQQAIQSQNHELASAAMDLQRQVQTGQLSIAQANQKLAELQTQQNYGLAQGGLQLAQKAQAAQESQFGQQFEAGQQQTAFNQAVMQAQLEEALRQGDFARAQALMQAGSFGNPSDTALALANSYGQQAGQAGSAAGTLVAGAIRNTAGGGGPSAPTDTGGATVDWQSLLSGLPGLEGELPPLANAGNPESVPPDWTYTGPVVQPRFPLAVAR